MPRFRKKPVEIEARQLTVSSVTEIIGWVNAEVDRAAGGLYESGVKVFVSTLEGTMTATEGDWIIKGVAGEFYPCKPDIFEETYEAVTNA